MFRPIPKIQFVKQCEIQSSTALIIERLSAHKRRAETRKQKKFSHEEECKVTKLEQARESTKDCCCSFMRNFVENVISDAGWREEVTVASTTLASTFRKFPTTTNCWSA